MKDAILKQLHEKTKKLKYTMSIHVIFEKAEAPGVKTVPPVVLTTEPSIWNTEKNRKAAYFTSLGWEYLAVVIIFYYNKLEIKKLKTVERVNHIMFKIG